jgi:hypothetical protein
LPEAKPSLCAFLRSVADLGGPALDEYKRERGL